MRKLVFLSCFLALFSAVLRAQAQDAHFQTPSIAAIARGSTFLHGYLHGYEEGFHQADIDLQMGRISRDDYLRNPAPTGYQKKFGPKPMFEAGYRKGFDVGFADGVDRHSYRAIANVQAAAGTIRNAAGPSGGIFDEGVESGYMAGQQQGLSDARHELRAHSSPLCPIRRGKMLASFCTAYASGYHIGYADGFTNQSATTLAQASK